MINEAFQETLNRLPDPDGMRFYEEKIKNDKWDYEQLIKSLKSSEEYLALKLGDFWPKLTFKDKDWLRRNRDFLPEVVEFLHSNKLSTDSLRFFFETRFDRVPDPINCDFYKSHPELLYNYTSRVNKGLQYMQKKKILICGLIRDSEDSVDELYSRISALFDSFKGYKVIVLENDSTDQTRELLLQYANRDKKWLIIGGGINQPKFKLGLPKTPSNKPASCERIKKMALLRNMYLEIVQNNIYNEYEYVAVIDMDLEGELYLDGIADTMNYFRKYSKIDVIACNGVMKQNLSYYDTFAHIDEGELGYWLTPEERLQHDKHVYTNVSQTYQTDLRLHRVKSAFGGFAIYRRDAFIKARYDYREDAFCCEHTLFHKSMTAVYVNPTMIYMITKNK